MIKKITSLQNQFIKDLVNLKTSKKMKKENRFLIEGDDLVSMAYETNQLDLIISLNEQEKYHDIEQIIVTKAIIKKLSNNKSPSDILAVAHYNKHKDFGEKVVFLDNVQDPGNVGTIIRTALSFSYSALVLGNNSSSLYNQKVIQSSKGAVFKLPIYEDVSLKDLKKMNYRIVSTALENSTNYSNLSLSGKFVLVFGNEGQGVCQETLSLSDNVVKINIDHIDSLNVAVAAGILLNHYRG